MVLANYKQLVSYLSPYTADFFHFFQVLTLYQKIRNSFKVNNLVELKSNSIMTIELFQLTHSHIMHLLTPLGNKPFENTKGKGEIAPN